MFPRKQRLGSIARLYAWKCRLATSRFRALPDFLIVGAQKAGTSSLYAYLAQHPHVIPSTKKEIHFFDDVDNYRKGSRWYRAHFPLAWRIRPQHRVFEASPKYLFFPSTPERIHDLIPDMKIIILLRDPVERAISQYFHNMRRAWETLSLGEALAQEEERIWNSENVEETYNFTYFSYKARGVYLPQIKRYHKVFGSQNICTMSSEFFFAHTDDAIKKVLRFLEVDEQVKIDTSFQKNIGTNRESVGVEEVRQLVDFFEPHNEELFSFLGERFPWATGRSIVDNGEDGRVVDQGKEKGVSGAVG